MEQDLSQRLMKARSGHGWSQADLAEVSGVAAAQVSRYEAGRATPRPPVLAKLAKAMAVRFEWLAFGQGEMSAGGDGDPPAYPSSLPNSIMVDLPEEARAVVQKIADRDGVTFNMAFNTLFREMLQKHVTTGKMLEGPHLMRDPQSVDPAADAPDAPREPR